MEPFHGSTPKAKGHKALSVRLQHWSTSVSSSPYKIQQMHSSRDLGPPACGPLTCAQSLLACGSHTRWFLDRAPGGMGATYKEGSILGRKRMFAAAPRNCIISFYLGDWLSVFLLISCPFSHFLSPQWLIYLKVCQHGAQMRSWASSSLLTASHANKSFFSSLANRGCEQRASRGLE